MSGINTFVPPRPNKAVVYLMTAVNRVFILNGVPLLRDLWPFKKIPPFRSLTNIRYLDFPSEDEMRLKAVCGAGKATFITPNHPEFFTDWMIDKEILARVSPLAASWATHGVVNGLGRLAQKFWLANNLIAQIPGNGAPAREHSEAWALKGHGVLLHPEGAVGWHGDFVAPLLPGAVEMSMEALEEGRKTDPRLEAWVAPIVWKLAFVEDVERPLLKECAHVERRLNIPATPADLSLPERIYRIYDTLLARDAERLALHFDHAAPFSQKQAAVVSEYSRQLASVLELDGAADADDLLRTARRRLRDKGGLDAEKAKLAKSLADGLARVRRVGLFAFAHETITLEELAEHLKRIRNDYCAGTLRDTVDRFVPQAAGPRRAYVRVPEPIAIHEFSGSPEEALDLLRTRMQAAVDAINTELGAVGKLRRYRNPFYGTRPDNAGPELPSERAL